MFMVLKRQLRQLEQFYWCPGKFESQPKDAGGVHLSVTGGACTPGIGNTPKQHDPKGVEQHQALQQQLVIYYGILESIEVNRSQKNADFIFRRCSSRETK